MHHCDKIGRYVLGCLGELKLVSKATYSANRLLHFSRPCHGQEDPTAVDSRAFYAGHLSLKKKEWVRLRLLGGNCQAQVLTDHRQWVAERILRGDHLDRDCFLSSLDVRNIAALIEQETYRFHDDDAESTRQWVQRNQSRVFFYEEANEARETAFSLGLMSDWQLDMLVKHGHQKVICMDATHGTNRWKV